MRVSADVTLVKDARRHARLVAASGGAAPSRVGTLPIGYVDGVPRTDAMSDGARSGQRARAVIGRVCMDLTMLDRRPAARRARSDPVRR
jgi:alanine racemase